MLSLRGDILKITEIRRAQIDHTREFNHLVLELDIYSLAHHLCKMSTFYEPRRLILGNTRHFMEE